MNRKRFFDTEKDQGFLLGHYLDSNLDNHHEIYAFKELLKQLNLTAITSTYKNEGGKMYDPIDVFGLIAYAYWKGVTSSIKICELGKTSIPFIYLTGNAKISSKTIRTFRQRHGDAIEQVLSSLINEALEVGLIKSDDVYFLDGTKIEANVDKSKMRNIKEWEERSKKLKEHIRNYLKESELVDSSEDEP